MLHRALSRTKIYKIHGRKVIFCITCEYCQEIFPILPKTAGFLNWSSRSRLDNYWVFLIFRDIFCGTYQLLSIFLYLVMYLWDEWVIETFWYLVIYIVFVRRYGVSPRHLFLTSCFKRNASYWLSEWNCCMCNSRKKLDCRLYSDIVFIYTRFSCVY